MRTSNDGAWRDAGDFDPRPWLDAGFTVAQAREWSRWGIGPEAARAWRDAGVPDALSAAQWSVAGVTPDTVGRWRAAGVAPTEAVRWHEFGFDLEKVAGYKRRGLTAEDAFAEGTRSQTATFRMSGAASGPMAMPLRAMRAREAHDAYMRFHNAGARPEISSGYFLAQWLDDEAVAWACQDIDAPTARQWKILGLTPPEAGRLARRGQSPEELIREWWRAGIPYDEVASWLGAGLSAVEAAQQRALGVTAEQAAALRALRDGDDEDEDDPT